MALGKHIDIAGTAHRSHRTDKFPGSSCEDAVFDCKDAAAPATSATMRTGAAEAQRAKRAHHAIGCAGAALTLLMPLTAGRAAASFDTTTRFGRFSIGGYTEGYGIIRTDPDSQHQHPEGTLRLNLRGDPHRSARLFTDIRLVGGGPPEDPDGFGVYNISDTFQNDNPAVEIEEAWLDLYLGPVDLRLGKQKFAWGKLDTFQPTDVLNPQSYRDPFVVTGVDAMVGIPAASGSYLVPDAWRGPFEELRLTLVWVPVPVATRFPLEEERWFPPATSVQDVNTFEVDIGNFGSIPVRSTNTLVTQNRGPSQQLDEGAVGVRIAGLYATADWSLYFYDGTETQPAFSLDTSVVRPDARRARRNGTPAPDLVPTDGPLRVRTDATLLPRFERIRLFGGDVALTFDRLTARAEAAFVDDRPLPRSIEDLLAADNITGALGTPAEVIAQGQRLQAGERVPIDLGDLFVTRDTIEWGVGADYTYRGWMPLLQINQTVVLDNDTDLLLSNVDTQLLFVVRKSFFAERLATEIAAVQGLARGYTLGTARFTYAVTDNLRVRVGYLLIAGSRRTLIGQYHDNDETFFQIRYSY